MKFKIMRSSSYNSYSLCPHKCFIEYSLGIKSKTNAAAIKGNAVHKVLELLAHKKLAQQEGKHPKIIQDDVFGLTDTGVCDNVEKLIARSAELHEKESPNGKWTKIELNEINKWSHLALNFNKGQFHPLNRNIVSPEQFFDFELQFPWANYDFNGDAGKLHLTGTMDLLTKLSPTTLELIDWKTGARKDWSTGKEKDYKYLCHDPQLMMYHYAASKLYPQYDQIIVTIFFIKLGEPFTICFDKSNIPTTELMIKRRFEQIKNDKKPKAKVDWRCRFCSFSKDVYPGTKDTYCDHFVKEIRKKGIDQVQELYQIETKYEGGGRKSDGSGT